MSKSSLTIITMCISACFLNSIASASDDLYADIKVKLFDANQPPMHPSLTLQLLKRLEEHYYHSNTNDPIRAGKIIKNLIGAWQVEEADCHRDGWNSLNRKISTYAGNARRYLQFCRENFFLVCQDAQSRNLSQASLHLTDLEFNNLNLLKDTVIENDPRWWREGSYLTLYLKDSQISFSAIQRGLLKFVEMNSPLENYNNDKGYFDKVLDQLVKFPCDKVEIHIAPKIDDIYRTFPELNDKGNDLVERLDQSTLNWIGNSKVCCAIRNNWEDLVNDAYKALQDKLREEGEKRAAWERAQFPEELVKQEEANKNLGLLSSIVNYVTSFFY